MAVVLPSGVGAGHFSVRVVESGRELELTVAWPTSLMGLKVLRRKWLQSEG